MAYTPKTWADDSAGATPITAVELNRIETGVKDANHNNVAWVDTVAEADALPAGTLGVILKALAPAVNTVQKAQANNVDTTGTIVCTLPLAPAVGNLCVATVGIDKNSGAISLPAGSGWTLAATYVNTSVSAAFVWRIATGAPEDKTVTVNWPGSVKGAMVIAETNVKNAVHMQTSTFPDPPDDLTRTVTSGNAGAAVNKGIAFGAISIDTGYSNTWDVEDGMFLDVSAPYTLVAKESGADPDGTGPITGTGGTALAFRSLSPADTTDITWTQGGADQTCLIVSRFEGTT